MSDEPAVDSVLWHAEGMSHEISLTESVRGMAIISVRGMPGNRREQATLMPSERYALARALYPEAFDGAHPFTTKEYIAKDRIGRPVTQAARGRHLVELQMDDDQHTLFERDTTAWREVES